MYSALAQKAVSEALSGNWKEAQKTNFQILKSNSQDIDALNRLARTYSELGLIPKARSTAQKVLKIDSVNPIAIKCLEKWKSLKNGDKKTSSLLTNESFLEEPGKTRLINLIHPGDANALAMLDAGDEVKFLTHTHRVSVVTQEGKYIGRLPDDLAARLRRLIKLGNLYQVLVKTIEGRDIKVFVRETLKADGAKSIPSFPPEKIEYVSFTPPELVHKEGPIMEEIGESPEE